MKKRTISFLLTTFKSQVELSEMDAKLMNSAIKAREKAYAPYSNFKVGAAVLMANGEIIIGSNQENASYPSGLCAERVAIFQAGALYPDETIKAVAITATSMHYTIDMPAAPCGNCRQSISEYEVRQKKPIAILMMGESGPVLKCDAIGDLLPLAFSNSFLK